jgi:hypothetical protein
MTAPTEKTLNYGLRYACVLELNASGTPKAASVTPYEGYQFKGSTAFEVNVPDARKLTGLGEDGITTVVFLPPTEGVDARLNVEASDPVIAALLDGTKVASIGEFSIVGLGTDKQGFEPQVALMLFQAARGLVTGKTYWHTFIIPSAQVVRKTGGMTADKSITVYQVAPNRVSKHLWGEAFANATEGYLSAQIVEAWSNYPLRLSSFVADGTAVDFSFPADWPAIQTTGIKVWKNGVIVSAGITLSTTKVTFAVAPTLADRIDVIREISG